jgi:hypothetical protein
MSTHPLARFINETFGEQFGGLVLAGYGQGPGGGPVRVCLTESEAGTETDWVIEVTALRHPCGDDPLVLAALLKLLVSRPVGSYLLEFEVGELLAELRWPDSIETRRRVDEVIAGYVGTLYIKQAGARAGRKQAASEGGFYHLLTGYVREALAGAGSVYFGDAFINGLKEGRVFFAGVDFGTLRKTQSLTARCRRPAEGSGHAG